VPSQLDDKPRHLGETKNLPALAARPCLQAQGGLLAPGLGASFNVRGVPPNSFDEALSSLGCGRVLLVPSLPNSSEALSGLRAGMRSGVDFFLVMERSIFQVIKLLAGWQAAPLSWTLPEPATVKRAAAGKGQQRAFSLGSLPDGGRPERREASEEKLIGERWSALR
jgi:hypothetical protein